MIQIQQHPLSLRTHFFYASDFIQGFRRQRRERLVKHLFTVILKRPTAKFKVAPMYFEIYSVTILFSFEE